VQQVTPQQLLYERARAEGFAAGVEKARDFCEGVSRRYRAQHDASSENIADECAVGVDALDPAKVPYKQIAALANRFVVTTKYDGSGNYVWDLQPHTHREVCVCSTRADADLISEALNSLCVDESKSALAQIAEKVEVGK
jgi:hypothetical protein